MAALGAALPVPKIDSIAFRLIRRGTEIGRHTLNFRRRDETLTVEIVVDALVTLLSVPVVRYSHRATETWQDTSLVQLQADTNKNGDRQWMRAHRDAEGLMVTGSKTRPYAAPEGALATSYWNRHMLDGPMISLEDGVLLRPKIVARGPESIRVASGAMITADHFNLSGAFDVDVWYDLADAWASMAVSVADGSEVRYERL
jgi:hypothetical protein